MSCHKKPQRKWQTRYEHLTSLRTNRIPPKQKTPPKGGVK
ncbi:hypothetical protein CHUV0807_1120 [Cardiobacterium hominis]|uniref:Uncharacterized protein n=1 Tax=Cardiobacterium hominis TaxID=2718 RepID=A0A1C3H415_9GAMM|nr:hypothetical protein CHUV0807_1120 [Cardiobacterium hominis]